MEKCVLFNTIKKGGGDICMFESNSETILISSLVMDHFFGKASAFDMFEALCEMSKTVWGN